MSETRLPSWRLRSTLAVLQAVVCCGILPAATAKPTISLTLIPPSPVTDQIVLELRAAVWNEGASARTFEIAFFLDRAEEPSELYRETVSIEPNAAKGVSFRWPTKGQVGKRRILVTAVSDQQTLRCERSLEVIASDVRSTRRIDGAWVDIYHFSEAEGKYFNAELGKMTEDQWHELVRAMRDVKMNVLVNTMLFQNYIHYGEHRIEQEGYQGKTFYPSKLFPGRMPTACPDALEAMLSEADKHGMHVFPGIGPYAFFDYTPGSLAWHKKVAEEVWQRYGHHPSFYGWYVSDEIAGHLGDDPVRWRQIVDFFRGFRAHCRRMAPDKPVMLATNSHHVPRAVETYQKLLPHLDILCPFGFHRMPADDVSGERAAELLQQLCDEAGCHLWMDLETFIFHEGQALYPRPIGGLVSDLRRFPNFEKILCYEYPGLMNAPWASIKPGGEPTVKLYRDYQKYLKEGYEGLLTAHDARGKPLQLQHKYSPMYTAAGDGALVDGVRGAAYYRDPAWQGYHGVDLVATIDLQRPIRLDLLGLSCLQRVAAGIFLPSSVEYLVSDDGRQFRTVATATHNVSPKEKGPRIGSFNAKLQDIAARYVRVRAQSIKTIPDWHQAAGDRAWLFADEILVNPKGKDRE